MVSAQDVLEQSLKSISAKDLRGAVEAFAPAGVLIDPHYPDSRMEGHDQIRDGLQWAFSGIRSFGFSPVAIFTSPDGGAAVAEVDSHHVMQNGRELRFRQVFVVEARNGLITRWQAYEPYGPDGLAGLLLGIGRLHHRIARRRAERRGRHLAARRASQAGG